MARKVLFSFSYEDVKNFKSNVVRQSWVTQNGEGAFVDGSIWETAKANSVTYLKNMIDDGMKNTSVTVVLIGEDTANRRWVNYEIVRSFERGNGLLGIHINRIAGRTGRTASGDNPLNRLGFEVAAGGRKIHFYELVSRQWQVYDDLPTINNKQSNTLYFEDSFWNGNEYGKFYRFSDKFVTQCWDMDTGYSNLASWVDTAARQAGRT